MAITAVILFASGVSVFAQGRGGGAQKPKAQANVPKAPTGGPKAPQGAKVNAQASAKPPKANVKTAKTTTATPPMKSAKSSGGAASPASSVSGAEKSTPHGPWIREEIRNVGQQHQRRNGAATGTGTTSGAATQPGAPTLTAVQQKLQKNTNLASKLQSRLPQGADLMKSAEGFRNLGQFVAAVNVSNNLGLDFTALKVKMVDDGLSLGQSIQSLKPASSGALEAQRARVRGARHDCRDRDPGVSHRDRDDDDDDPETEGEKVRWVG